MQLQHKCDELYSIQKLTRKLFKFFADKFSKHVRTCTHVQRSTLIQVDDPNKWTQGDAFIKK